MDAGCHYYLRRNIITDSEASSTTDDQNEPVEKDGLAEKIIADSRPLGGGESS